MKWTLIAAVALTALTVSSYQSFSTRLQELKRQEAILKSELTKAAKEHWLKTTKAKTVQLFNDYSRDQFAREFAQQESERLQRSIDQRNFEQTVEQGVLKALEKHNK